MKQLFTLCLALISTASLFAQAPVKGGLPGKESIQMPDAALPANYEQKFRSNDNHLRASSPEYWINFPEAVESFYGSGAFGPSPLWPDSTVKIIPTTNPDFFWWQHGFAQYFDPSSSLIRDWIDIEYGDDQWGEQNHKYTIDSIAFLYLYERNRPSTDTLRVYTMNYNSTAFDPGDYYFAPGSSYPDTVYIKLINYDYMNNRPMGTYQMQEILLDQDDTASNPYRVITLPVNLTVPASVGRQNENVVAVAFEFSPGHSWNFGDTLIDANNNVVNPVNYFGLRYFEEIEDQRPSSYEDGEYNMGNLASTEVRYNLSPNPPGWNGTYINNFAYTPTFFNEHVYMEWLVTEEFGVGIDENGKYELGVYPNPATDNLIVRFKSDAAVDFDISITNVQGQVIFNKSVIGQTEVNENINIGTLPSGVYFVQVTDGVTANTKEFVINR